MKKITLLFVLGFSFIVEIKAQSWNEIMKSVAADRSIAAQYGYSVDIDGDYAIIGAYTDNYDLSGGQLSIQAGSVYILKLDASGNWNQVKKIIASDRDDEALFGCSVAIHGQYAIVGAMQNKDSGGNKAGAAYILIMDNAGNWFEHQKIIPSDLQSKDNFGVSVDIYGDYAIVGSSMNDLDTAGKYDLSNAGAAYIFKKETNGNWIQCQKLTNPYRYESDRFGNSVSISNEFIVIGAIGEDEDTNNGNTMTSAGSAFIFTKNKNGAWDLEQKITATDRDTFSSFGYSVSIDSNYLVVGAIGEDFDADGANYLTGAGAAYVFERKNSGIWTQVAKLINEERNESDYFGTSVSIKGANIIVGSKYDDDTISGQIKIQVGSAAIFENKGNNNWVLVERLIAGDGDTEDYFGCGVAIDSKYAFVGAYQEDEDASGGYKHNAAGSVYIFKRNCGIIDTAVTVSGYSLMANLDWKKYQWLDCTNNYAPIQGANSRIFTPAKDGSYAVEITDNNCTDTSSCHSVTGVGIEEHTYGTTMNVYPNPTSGNVNIGFEKTQTEVWATIRNMMGQTLLKKKYNSTNQIRLYLNEEPGVYFVEITSMDGVQTVVKILKK